MKEFSEQLLKVILDDYPHLNLTRIVDPQEFYTKQVIDSSLVTDSHTFKNKKIARWIDVGFGGGFPLLPLAKENPEVKFIGLERKRKKVKAVEEIALKMNLNNVKVFHQDIGNLFIDLPACMISFKAVGRVEDLLPLIHFKQGCSPTVCFYKGPNFNKLEGDSLKKIAKDWKIVEDRCWELEGTEGRKILFFEPSDSKGKHQTPSKLVNLSSMEQG